MIKFLVSISFLSILPAQAMLHEDVMADGKRLGRYPLYQEGGSGAVKGNATLFRTEDGKTFGITCAHCVPYLNSLSCIKTDEEAHENFYKVTSYSSISNIQTHPLYKEKEHPEPKDSRYDIALFTMKENPKLTYFTKEISTDELKETIEYPVCVTSFGPLFAKDGSSYEESVFHQIDSSLKFSEEDFFFHPFQSRNFYFSFLPTQNDEFTWNYGLLSALEECNLLSGDSGSLAIDEEGKAVALASAVDRDISPLIQLLQLDTSSERELNVEKYDEKFKRKLLEIIEKIADHAHVLRQPSGEEIYVFSLKKEVPAIHGNDYYTPLALHSDFIKGYIDNISESSQEYNRELKVITVDETAGLYHDPETVETCLNYDAILSSHVFGPPSNPRDVDLLKTLYAAKGWDWKHDDKAQEEFHEGM